MTERMIVISERGLDQIIDEARPPLMGVLLIAAGTFAFGLVIGIVAGLIVS